jgi:sphingomyelin phosphodiesterase acid-like 3
VKLARPPQLAAFGGLLLLFFSCFGAAGATAPGVARPWLAISDVHYGPAIGGSGPSLYGQDTNDVLLDALLSEAHRVDPNPPVVLVAGDFLAHHFRGDIAAATIVRLAQRFNTVFPHAQFLITLGNNDSACGDYAAPIDGPFLSSVERAWEPLVNRRGAAPGFAKTFAHDGSYLATLPRAGLHAAVVNDVPFALRYDTTCAPNVDAAAIELGDLQRMLANAPAGSRAWVLLHVPPGIDAYTTNNYTHRLAIIPFTRPRAREALEKIVEDPRNRVSLIVAGHTHKFGYRVLSGKTRVPLLLVPSVSPIFYNAPSFLTLAVDETGTIDRVDEHAYTDGAWRDLGGLASLGVQRFDAAQLLALQGRLKHSAQLRASFSRLYSGGGPAEITESNWREYWCAATEFSATAYQRCEAQSGYSLLTPRALFFLRFAAIGVGVLCIVGIAGTVAVVVSLRRQAP